MKVIMQAHVEQSRFFRLRSPLEGWARHLVLGISKHSQQKQSFSHAKEKRIKDKKRRENVCFFSEKQQENEKSG